MFILTDTFLTFTSGTPHEAYNRGRIFIDMFGFGDQTSATDKPTLKIRRLGPLELRGPRQFTWVTTKTYEVPQNVHSLTMTVSVDDPNSGNHLVIRIELDVTRLRASSLGPNNRFLTKQSGEDVTVNVSSACIYIPLDGEPAPNGLPSHAQFQHMLQGYSDGFHRLTKIGSYFFDRFFYSRDQADLDRAVSYHEYSVSLTPDSNPSKPGRLKDLGDSFLHRFLHFGDLVDIDKAISHYEGAVGLAPDDHAHKATFLYNLGSSFLHRSDRLGDLVDIEKANVLLEQALHLTSDGHAVRPNILADLGTSFFSRYEKLRDLKDVNKSISYHEHAIGLLPDGHAHKSILHNILGASFLYRFQYLGDLVDIDKAVSHHEIALRLTPDANDYTNLNNIGALYSYRFEHSGDLMDIEKAFTHHKHAARLIPDADADKRIHLSNLGSSFLDRFKYLGDPIDIEKAISHHEHVLRLAPDGHDRKPMYLNNLGSSYLHRFKYSGDITDIDKAIVYQEDAVDLTPDGHVDKPHRLNSLGASYFQRFDRSGDLMDINKAISYHERAVELTPDGHANKPSCLNSLASSFLLRFDHLGHLMDVNEAISLYEQAVQLIQDGHASKTSFLKNLGSSFSHRFDYSGDLMDINKAISHHEHALHLTSDGHADKPTYFNSLGTSYMRRFAYSGDLIDIDKAISHHENALHLTPDGHADRPIYFNNLGTAYLNRSTFSGDLADVDKAISHHEYAVGLIPDDNADKPKYLNALGNSFSARFSHIGDPIDNNKAISHQEHAVRLTPDSHAEKPTHLGSLGNSYADRYKQSGDLIDIDKAIPLLEHAVQLTPAGRANKATRLHNLGKALLSRFEQVKILADVDQAISHTEHATLLVPDGHVDKHLLLFSLGTSYALRFQHGGNATDLQKATLALEASAKSSVGTPSLRFRAAVKWAHLSHADPAVSLSAYKIAISLLPRIVWLGQSVSDRYKYLALIGDIATEAAASAIASKKLDIALELLEQGRSVVWGQLLNLRTPLDDLYKVDRNLADDLISTSRALESASMHGTNYESPETHLSLEKAAQTHRRLAEKWDDLLKSIQMLPGFEDFLLPKRLPSLLRAARSGPVAVINVHESQSDALVLLPGLDNVLHIPLGGTFYDEAKNLQYQLHGHLQAAGIAVWDGRGIGPVPPHANFARILASLWTNLAKPVLDQLAYHNPNSSDPPRIWWCPTGPLTFLPIHAAGIYGQSPSGSNISLTDFVISSYTPTITALLGASHEAVVPFKGLLGVSQSGTPGLRELPNADKELELIKEFSASLNIRSLQGEAAAVAHVLDGMEESSWIHLACHATQHSSLPLQSAFCLNDGRLTLSHIMTRSFPNADFAFLSACETATGDKNLPEEAVHLAAGMLVAGYKSIIATMWSIGDDNAPLIASKVYQHLVSGPSGPDSSKAAYALHQAVKQLRETLGTDGTRAFLSWVPYIHVGR